MSKDISIRSWPRVAGFSMTSSDYPEANSQEPPASTMALKLNYSPLQRDGDGLGAVHNRELSENAADVELHRALGDIQCRRDLSIAFSSDKQSQHVELASGEARTRHAFGEKRRHLRRDVTAAARRLTNRLRQFFALHGFREIAHRAALKRAVDFF